MNCLSERELMELCASPGDSAMLSHVNGCASCGTHYRLLRSDLDLICSALDSAPPAVARRPGFFAAPFQTIAARAAFAMALVLITAVGLRMTQGVGSRTVPGASQPNPSTDPLLAEISPMLFPDEDSTIASLGDNQASGEGVSLTEFQNYETGTVSDSTEDVW